MKHLILLLLTIAITGLSPRVVAEELPEGVTMKETQSSNPMATVTRKDYYRDGKCFFSDVIRTLKGAPKKPRAFHFHDGSFTILIVDAENNMTHYSGKKNYRMWISSNSITIFCLDDGFYLGISFGKDGNPIFQSKAEHEADKKIYIGNKDKYRMMKAPRPK